MAAARKPRPPARGLTFVPSQHRYTLDGKPVPGVTSIIGILDKSSVLTRWAATTVAEYVADHEDTLVALRSGGRHALVAALSDVHELHKQMAGARGHQLHEYAEQLLRGDDLDIDALEADSPDLIPVLEHAVAFLEDWQVAPLLVEAQVANRADWWAGTLDLVADVTPPGGERVRAVLDWKSGKRIYPEAAWQVCAYGHAEFTGLRGDERPLPEGITAGYGIHIRPDGYDVYPLAYSDEVYEEFRVIRQAFDAAKRGRGDWRVPGSGHVGAAIQSVEGVDVEVAS